MEGTLNWYLRYSLLIKQITITQVEMYRHKSDIWNSIRLQYKSISLMQHVFSDVLWWLSAKYATTNMRHNSSVWMYQAKRFKCVLSLELTALPFPSRGINMDVRQCFKQRNPLHIPPKFMLHMKENIFNTVSIHSVITSIMNIFISPYSVPFVACNANCFKP